jgi:hypothetical protein
MLFKFNVYLDALLHDGERGIEPADIHASALNQGARVQLGGADLGGGRRAVHQRNVVQGTSVGLKNNFFFAFT